MKLLLDTCVWGGAVLVLQEAGHDVIWVGDWDADPGDEEILAQARAQERVLVTLDKDFGELAVVYGKPHSGIVRLVGIPARRQGLYCSHILKRYQQELQQRAIITVTQDRVRIRTCDPQ